MQRHSVVINPSRRDIIQPVLRPIAQGNPNRLSVGPVSSGRPLSSSQTTSTATLANAPLRVPRPPSSILSAQRAPVLRGSLNQYPGNYQAGGGCVSRMPRVIANAEHKTPNSSQAHVGISSRRTSLSNSHNSQVQTVASIHSTRVPSTVNVASDSAESRSTSASVSSFGLPQVVPTSTIISANRNSSSLPERHHNIVNSAAAHLERIATTRRSLSTLQRTPTPVDHVRGSPLNPDTLSANHSAQNSPINALIQRVPSARGHRPPLPTSQFLENNTAQLSPGSLRPPTPTARTSYAQAQNDRRRPVSPVQPARSVRIEPASQRSVRLNGEQNNASSLSASPRHMVDYDNEGISPSHTAQPVRPRPPSASSSSITSRVVEDRSIGDLGSHRRSILGPHIAPFIPPESYLRNGRATNRVDEGKTPDDTNVILRGDSASTSQRDSSGYFSPPQPSSEQSPQGLSSASPHHMSSIRTNRNNVLNASEGSDDSSDQDSEGGMSPAILRALREIVTGDVLPHSSDLTDEKSNEFNSGDESSQEERLEVALLNLSERARMHSTIVERLESMEQELVRLVERRSLLDNSLGGGNFSIERSRESRRLDQELRRSQRSLELLQLEAQISNVALMRAQIAALDQGGASQLRGLNSLAHSTFSAISNATQDSQSNGRNASFVDRAINALSALSNSSDAPNNESEVSRDTHPHFGLVSDREGTQMIAMIIPPLLVAAASAAITTNLNESQLPQLDFAAVTSSFKHGAQALAYALGSRGLQRVCRSAALMQGTWSNQDPLSDFLPVDPQTGALRDPRPFPMGDRLMRVRTNDFVVPLVLPGGNVVSGMDISIRLVARADRALTANGVIRSEDHERIENEQETVQNEDRELNQSSRWLLNDLWSLWQLTRALGGNALGSQPTDLVDSRGSLVLIQQVVPRNYGLSEADLKRLPRWKTPKSYSSDDPCCICLDVVEAGQEVTVLVHCHHHFHSACSDDWWKRSSQCPLCKRHAITGEATASKDSPNPSSTLRSRGQTRSSNGYRAGSYEDGSYVDENGERVIQV